MLDIGHSPSRPGLWSLAGAAILAAVLGGAELWTDGIARRAWRGGEDAKYAKRATIDGVAGSRVPSGAHDTSTDAASGSAHGWARGVGQVPAYAPRPSKPHGDVTASAVAVLCVDRQRRLLDAIAAVESGGRDEAVGDAGRSRGRYQIGRAYWRDGCEFGGAAWDYDACVLDAGKCEQVMLWYWARHGARTAEERARMHNGGPGGTDKPAALGYWQKVRAEMARGNPR